MATEFVREPLDTRYVKPVPPGYLSASALPREDWEVRESLAFYKVALNHWNSCSFFSALFRTKAFTDAKALHDRQLAALGEVVGRSPVHRAALYRVLNDMPDGGVSARRALCSLLDGDGIAA